MKIFDTYVIRYTKDGKEMTAWLSKDSQLSSFENSTIIETRPMLYADDGLVLFRDGEETGEAIWLRDGDSIENYTEGEHIEPEMEEEHV